MYQTDLGKLYTDSVLDVQLPDNSIDWVGIEISEKYCAEIKKRVSAEAAQRKLAL